jgi:hypothetical protein
MWFQGLNRASARPAARRVRRTLGMESLEARQMMHGDALDEFSGGPDAIDVATTPVVIDPVVRVNTVPPLSSLPGAPATLYLDFDGHYQSADRNTPPFDLDGNTGNLSAVELDAIRQIWASVAEDYAPFNLNVTTVDPGDFSNGSHHLRIAIGGQTFDSSISTTGISVVNSFTNSAPNIGFVFDHKLDGTTFAVHTISEVVSHEAGHAFGLWHQSTYNSSGVLVDEYNAGDSLRAPIMGNSYHADRGLWMRGPTNISSNSMLSPGDGQYVIFMGARYILGQDDMARIARSANGFGYRADDHPFSYNLATPLTMGNYLLTGHGIIEKTTDKDVFKFETGGGNVSVNVLGARYISPVTGAPTAINNLDMSVELRSATGTLIASAADSHNVQELLSANVAAGTYYIVVGSNGSYGDVGQYTVEVTELRGPRVVSAERSHLNDTLDAIYVTFNEPIDTSSFTAADVYFGSPPNVPTNVSVAPRIDGEGREFIITYTKPTTFDVQSVAIGPFITDLFGNWMNQDGDNVNGESEDRFVKSFLSSVDTASTMTGSTLKTSTTAGGEPSSSLQPSAVDAIFAIHGQPRRKR